MLAYTILILCFLVAFVRPYLGIVVILFVSSTLFQLSQFATISFGLGNLEPTEIILLASVLGVMVYHIRRKGLELLTPSEDTEVRGRRFEAKRVLASAILPYVIWQAFCVVCGFLFWPDPDFLRSGLRFIPAGLFPWAIVWIFISLPNTTPKVMRLATLLAFGTAAVHIVIHVFDYRPIVSAAYWQFGDVDNLSAVEQDRLRWLAEENFVRCLPQGVILILFTAIYFWVALQTATHRRKGYAWGFGILASAIAITITRSLMIELIFGCVLGTTLVILHGIGNRGTSPRQLVIRALVIGIGLGGLYEIARPGFFDLWQERAGSLITRTDAMIFSMQNESRGLDNIASLRAIADSPLLGWGITLYPMKYSFRGFATDSHPLLVVGLVGGLPGVLLLLRLFWMVLWHFGRFKSMSLDSYRLGLPLICVLATAFFIVNTTGAGGTLSGNGLVVMCIFISALVDVYIYKQHVL